MTAKRWMFEESWDKLVVFDLVHSLLLESALPRPRPHGLALPPDISSLQAGPASFLTHVLLLCSYSALILLYLKLEITILVRAEGSKLLEI